MPAAYCPSLGQLDAQDSSAHSRRRKRSGICTSRPAPSPVVRVAPGTRRGAPGWHQDARMPRVDDLVGLALPEMFGHEADATGVVLVMPGRTGPGRGVRRKSGHRDSCGRPDRLAGGPLRRGGAREFPGRTERDQRPLGVGARGPWSPCRSRPRSHAARSRPRGRYRGLHLQQASEPGGANEDLDRWAVVSRCDAIGPRRSSRLMKAARPCPGVFWAEHAT